MSMPISVAILMLCFAGVSAWAWFYAKKKAEGEGGWFVRNIRRYPAKWPGVAVIGVIGLEFAILDRCK